MHIDEIVEELKYYNEMYEKGTPVITDLEYDSKYLALKQEEKRLGWARPDSPTQTVGIPVPAGSALAKVEHTYPMLSLDKSKDLKDIFNFIDGHPYVAMFKMDGLTIRLTYVDGKLKRAETRGDGHVGEDVTFNIAGTYGVPTYIPFIPGEYIVDGELICDIESFIPIARTKENPDGYANPRNYAAGAIRRLDGNPPEAKLTFVAWDVIKSDLPLFKDKLNQLEMYGFIVPPNICVDDEEGAANPEVLTDIVQSLSIIADTINYPMDGLVFKYNDNEYYESLGATSHHFRGGYAFKYDDELKLSVLTDVVWEPSRNGILTPVAVFAPIDIEGTKVSRASLHNLSVMEELYDGMWFQGMTVEVYKANEIIPQIKMVSDEPLPKIPIGSDLPIPDICPSCGEPLEIRESADGIKVLCCNNDACPSQLSNRIAHFADMKKGVAIQGLSKKIAEKLLDAGLINSILDLYSLADRKKEFINLPGFGEKSVQNILDAIEASKNCDLAQFISSLGIPGIGINTAKEICNYTNSWEDFRDKVQDRKYHFSDIRGFGSETEYSIKMFNYTEADEIAKLFNISPVEKKVAGVGGSETLKGKTIAITGKSKLGSRDAVKALIEAAGGKVTGSVSSKTSYLLANNPDGTSKYQNAITYGTPIIDDEQLSVLLGLKDTQ